MENVPSWGGDETASHWVGEGGTCDDYIKKCGLGSLNQNFTSGLQGTVKIRRRIVEIPGFVKR